MTKRIPINEIIAAAGGNSRIARRIKALRGKFTPQAVSMWDAVPISHVGIVSELSGIPRHRIRPDRPDLFPPPERERRAG